MTKHMRVWTVLLALAGGLTAVASKPAAAIPLGGVAAEAVLELQVGGTAGVPMDALAVVLNTTVTNPTTAGFVTVFPCGAERPVASNLNYVKDQTIPNLVIAKLGAGGKVCFYSQQAVDLIVDVAGFFPAGSGYVAQASPQRAADTRGKARVGGTTIQDIAVTGVFGVPTTATGVALNVTIAGASSDGFATVFPCGQQTPTASNVNYAKGQDIPNFVIATPGVGGKVCVFSSAPADVIVDVSGYFEQGSGFTATAAPVRFLDSRETTRIIAGTSKELTVAGDKGIPADARGVAMNVTAVGASADGFMTVYPCGQPTPVASNLNYTKARDVANFVLAKPGTNGKVCFYSDKTIDLVVDISGYFGVDSTFSPIPIPTRILDTRMSPVPLSVSAGGYATCAVLPNGTVKCWGGNLEGSLGDGGVIALELGQFPNKSAGANLVVGISNAISVDVGRFASACAVLSTHTIKCWGDGVTLGDGSTTTASSVPMNVSGITDAVGVAVGWSHACAVLLTGAVKCWGSTSGGQLGSSGLDSASYFSRVPVVADGITDAVEVSAGENSTCARLRGGTVKCWGSGVNTPVAIDGISDAVSLDVGDRQACAVVTNGLVKCWRVGSGSPVAVPGITGATKVSAGFGTYCAVIGTLASVKCWTTVDYGGYELGNGTWGVSSPIPVSVGLSEATGVTVGGFHACAVLSKGEIQCWGRNGYGELGNDIGGIYLIDDWQTRISTTPAAVQVL